MELSIDILHLFATCRWKFPATFLKIFLKIPMIFAFSCKTSVKLFINIFGKMSMEISLDIFLSIKDTDDILLLFSKTSVENFINTLQIYFQNVDVNFHRHFASISRSESNLQGFQSNISGNKFTENEQFLLKRFTSGKNIVF